jgi:hypothetical protein
MITCQVCGTENDDLAVVCRSCKSYVQGKVDTLNLFETLWGLMESPSRTFKKIALARSKNYVLPLAALCGIAAVYAAFWAVQIGRTIEGLVSILGIGLAIGIPAGILGLLLLSAALRIAARALAGNGTLKNVFAVCAYASTPVLLSLVVVFPVEIALFGIYLFDRNPSPMVLKPVPYIVLAVIDAIALLWSFVLLGIGLRVATGLTRVRAFALAGVAAVVVVGGLVAAVR